MPDTGGPTYCALAALHLGSTGALTPEQHKQTTRWLLYNQHGGFSGRTNKPEDPCYCFWNGASIAVGSPLGLHTAAKASN